MIPTVPALIGLAALLIADGWFAGMANAARRGGWPRWHAPTAVGGTMRLVRCGFAIPESDAYATLGGFLVALLQRQPRVEEVVEYAGWRYTIVQVAGQGVGQVLVARPDQDTTGATRIDKP